MENRTTLRLLWFVLIERISIGDEGSSLADRANPSVRIELSNTEYSRQF